MLRLAPLWFAVPVVALAAAGALGASVIADRMSANGKAQTRQAAIQGWLARDAALTAQSLQAGASLACLDGGAGDAVEAACERAVFADAQSTARAVAYVAARVSLLKEAEAFKGEGGLAPSQVASVRHMLEVDRFGMAAQVLSSREGCNAESNVQTCTVLGLVHDTAALKSNLRLGVFDQYVSRHADAWNGPAAPVAAAQAQQGVSAVASAPSPVDLSSSDAPAPAAAIKPGEKWDYPSANSIPPVSIMASEPPRPKEPASPPGAAPSPGENAAVPVPPRRPQVSQTPANAGANPATAAPVTR